MTDHRCPGIDCPVCDAATFDDGYDEPSRDDDFDRDYHYTREFGAMLTAGGW